MTPRLKKHHDLEGVTYRSINWVWGIEAEDQCESSESQAYGGWILLSACEPQTESCCLHCLFSIHFFSLSYWLPKEQQENPASLCVMVFWFQFPISSLSQFDKVTSRCHLQYPAPFTQVPWNAIINMKYCPDRLQLFQREKHWCLLFRNQVLAPGASHYLFSLGQTKKNLQRGLLISRLFVLLLQFRKTRLSQLLLIIWTTRWNDTCQRYIYIAKTP